MQICDQRSKVKVKGQGQGCERQAENVQHNCHLSRLALIANVRLDRDDLRCIVDKRAVAGYYVISNDVPARM